MKRTAHQFAVAFTEEEASPGGRQTIGMGNGRGWCSVVTQRNKGESKRVEKQ
jgi:hypothetical protein